MISEKLVGILLSRTNLAQEDFLSMTEADGWKIVYELDAQERISKQQSQSPEICFTGFGKSDKDRLSELATTAGFVVKDAVTKDLSLLVAGENAGPSKLKKAEARIVR